MYGTLAAYAVKLTLVVQIAGVSVRLLSSFLWIQIYRQGVSSADGSAARDADADLRFNCLNSATHVVRHPYDVIDDAYDPANFLPLFGDRARDDSSRYGVCSFLFKPLFILLCFSHFIHKSYSNMDLLELQTKIKTWKTLGEQSSPNIELLSSLNSQINRLSSLSCVVLLILLCNIYVSKYELLL